MAELCFVFASNSEKDADGVIGKYFADAEYDIKFLCSSKKEKILKKDIDLDLTELDSYKLICPIGAESLKYTAGLTGVQKYNGVFVEKRYLPIMHPNMTIFKPQLNDDIVSAFSKIKPILQDDNIGKEIQKDYQFIETQAQLDKILPQYEKVDTIVVDIETTSLSARKGVVIGIAMSSKEHQGHFVSLEVVTNNFEYFFDLFANKLCVFHNAKFDMQFLEDSLGFVFDRWDDTMLLHYCLEEAVGTHGLKTLALRFTDLGDYEKELDDYKKTFARKNKIKLADFNYGMLPMDILAPYACKDADATFQLYNKFKPLVDKSKEFNYLYNTILKPATKALKVLERTGGPIDLKQLEALDKEYKIDIEECIEEISHSPHVQRFERIHNKTFNPNSTMQLRQLFFDIIGLKSKKKTATGALSVDKEVLQTLDHPLAQAVLDLREKSKLSGTYISNIVNGIDKDGRLRSGFNIQGERWL
jgi:DNA polymerase I-like protein with 3'-5' exonuclease and polymerase domains